MVGGIDRAVGGRSAWRLGQEGQQPEVRRSRIDKRGVFAATSAAATHKRSVMSLVVW